MIRIASYNVENLYARPKVFDSSDWTIGEPILLAYQQVNTLFAKNQYNANDKQTMLSLLERLEIYTRNDVHALRRKYAVSPRWAWLRKNRGSFDREPQDRNLDVSIIANSRNDWIGWVELAKGPTNEISTRMTSQVIRDVNADIIGIVEAEDRPSLVKFNSELLGGMYDHVMLIDGNDERGIDVGIMTKSNFPIESIQSNVDRMDNAGIIFSRDCPQYTVRTPNGTIVHVLINHFKSQSGGTGDAKRRRQAGAVRAIADNLINQGQHVVVMGDLNEGPQVVGQHAPNLTALYNNNSRLVECFSLAAFQIGNRPGTFDSCGIRNRFDYIFISQSLVQNFIGGTVFRNGLWGSRVTRPTDWPTYPQITNSSEQASDHGAIYIDLNI